MKKSSFPIPFFSQKLGYITGDVVCKIGPGDGTLGIKGEVCQDTIDSIVGAIECLKVVLKDELKAGDYLDRLSIEVAFPGPVAGPSLSLGVLCALILGVTNRKLDGVAATGWVKEDGSVAEIGCVNDKIIAAKADGYKEIMIPYDNWDEVPEWMPQLIKVHPVRDVREVFALLARN